MLKAKIMAFLLCTLLINFWGASAATPPLFQKDSTGMIKPFKVKDYPLAQFAREFALATGKKLEVSGKWEEGLSGSIQLFVTRPLDPAKLEELLHQVLDANGYAAVDGPQSSGWLIIPTRDARDRGIPFYESGSFPKHSYRLMTVAHTLKNVSADEVSRVVRSFMTTSSRVIPATQSKLLITSTGRNIKHVLDLIALIDRPESRNADAVLPSAKECKPTTQKIESVVVNHLEVGNVTKPEGKL